MKSILIATDGSESAREAAALRHRARPRRGRGAARTSVRPPTFHGRGGLTRAVTPIEEVHGAETHRRAAADEARAAGVDAHAHEAHGDEATAIAAPPTGSTSTSWSSAAAAAAPSVRSSSAASRGRCRALRPARDRRALAARRRDGGGRDDGAGDLREPPRRHVRDRRGDRPRARGAGPRVQVAHVEDVDGVAGFEAVVVGSARLRGPLAGARAAPRRAASRRAGGTRPGSSAPARSASRRGPTTTRGHVDDSSRPPARAATACSPAGSTGTGSGFGERAMVFAFRAPDGDFRDWDAIGAWASASRTSSRRRRTVPLGATFAALAIVVSRRLRAGTRT